MLQICFIPRESQRLARYRHQIQSPGCLVSRNFTPQQKKLQSIKPSKKNLSFVDHWKSRSIQKSDTLPETNIAPKNDGFPIGISFSRGLSSGAMLVSGRVIFSIFVELML